jgi:hypothetical protein
MLVMVTAIAAIDLKIRALMADPLQWMKDDFIKAL